MNRKISKDSIYLKDIQEIENLCSIYDLDDPVSNKRLHRYMKEHVRFSSWIGENFLLGLKHRSKSGKHRRRVELICKISACGMVVLAVALVMIMGYTRLQEEKEQAVLEYIRSEREYLAASRLPAEQEQVEQPGESDESGMTDSLYQDVIQMELETDTQEPEQSTEESTEETVAVLPQYAALASRYPGVVGWLKVPGTAIDYPVMQHPEDDSYYLKHNFEGEADSKGSLFVDMDTRITPLDKNVVIFGHNMRSGKMFGSLSKYLDPDFYEQYQYVEFDTLYELGTYEIVAVVRTAVLREGEEGFRYYWFHNYSEEEEFEAFTDFISENRLYDTGKKLEYGDQTIILSTCEYTVDNGRLALIARRIA